MTEISDAVVDAALNAWNRYSTGPYGRSAKQAMRLAIEAADKTRGIGVWTAPQASPIAHGVEDGGAVGTAPSSANIEDLRDHVEGLRDQVDGLRAQVSALSTALVIARVRDQHGLPP